MRLFCRVKYECLECLEFCRVKFGYQCLEILDAVEKKVRVCINQILSMSYSILFLFSGFDHITYKLYCELVSRQRFAKIITIFQYREEPLSFDLVISFKIIMVLINSLSLKKPYFS